MGALPAGTTRLGPPGEKLSPTTTNLVCDSREFATRSSPSTGYGRPPSLRAAVHCLRHYRFLTNSTDVSAVRPAAQVHTAPVAPMESEDPNLVLREIGVWAGREQAGSANTRLFLLDLLKDEGAHDDFLLREAGPTRFRRARGIIVLTQKHLRIVQTKGSRIGGLRFQLTYQQSGLETRICPIATFIGLPRWAGGRSDGAIPAQSVARASQPP